MIFDLEQVNTNFDRSWFGVKDGHAFLVALSPFEKGRLRVKIDYPKDKHQVLCFDPLDTKEERMLSDRLSFKVYEEDERKGMIVGKTKSCKGFLQSYSYLALAYGEKNYYLYEVGFGHKGLYLCVYQEDHLIAIADKALVVKNYHDMYKIYAEDEANLQAILPLLLYYDLITHGDFMEVSLYSKKKKVVNTIQKELKEKYDPAFIERILHSERSMNK